MGTYVHAFVVGHARRALLAVVLVLGWQQLASAQQLVLLDQTVNPRSGLPASEFADSHYYIYAKDFANPAPASLSSPVNYAQGKVHIRLEVLTKPSDAETYFNVCFDNGGATCTGYVPKYTKPGVYEYEKPLQGQYNYDSFDFNKQLVRLALVIKNGMEQKPQVGDSNFAQFYPTQLRVTMTLVAMGGTYVAPGGAAPAPTPPVAEPMAEAGGQLVLVDGRVTANASNTDKSEYTYELAKDLPASLTSPVDYGMGRIHARLEVFTKPGDAPTYLTACIENADAHTCTAYINNKTYTTTGIYDHEQTVASMFNFANYDWSKPIDRVYFVLKDPMDALVQGDPDYYPTDVRLTVTMIPPGATYTPPGATPPVKDPATTPAGTGGSGGSKAPGGGAAGAAGAAANAGASAGSGTTTGASAGSTAGRAPAASAGSGAGSLAPEEAPEVEVYPSGSNVCTVGSAGAPVAGRGWLLGLLTLSGLALSRPRRRKRH